MIIREPYIFEKDNIELYPHKLHKNYLNLVMMKVMKKKTI